MAKDGRFIIKPYIQTEEIIKQTQKIASELEKSNQRNDKLDEARKISNISNQSKIKERTAAKEEKKTNKQQITNLRSYYRLKDQYTKLGFNEEKRREAINNYAYKSPLMQVDTELQNKEKIRELSGERKNNQRSTNTYLAIANVATRAIGESSKALQTQEKRSSLDKSVAKGGLSYLQARKLSIKAYGSTDDIAESFFGLRNLAGEKVAKELVLFASKLSDVNYSISEVSQDFQGYLQGGGLSETGELARKLGRSKIVSLNQQNERDSDLVRLGVIRNLEDPILVKRRKERLKEAESNVISDELANRDLFIEDLRAVDSLKEENQSYLAKNVLKQVAKTTGQEGNLKSLIGSKQESLIANTIEAGESLASGNFIKAGFEGTQALLEAGKNISEIPIVKKTISNIKGFFGYSEAHTNPELQEFTNKSTEKSPYGSH